MIDDVSHTSTLAKFEEAVRRFIETDAISFEDWFRDNMPVGDISVYRAAELAFKAGRNTLLSKK